jgi:hypothetical protein
MRKVGARCRLLIDHVVVDFHQPEEKNSGKILTMQVM